MKITAVAVGTRGDVNPLVELVSEMTKKGKGRTELAKAMVSLESALKKAADAQVQYDMLVK